MMDARNRMAILAALSAGAALAGCGERHPGESMNQTLDRNAEQVAAATPQAMTRAGAVVDDAAITVKVKSAVIAEPGLKSLQIDVDTKDGVVTLSGTVDNPALKERAAQIAQHVSGVRSVVDNLAVKSTG